LGESAKQILRHKELSDEQMWDTLIEKYQSHPLWLDMTATMIQELFAAKVTEFLAYSPLILSSAIVSQLSRLWRRLSDSEKQVVNYLAQQDDAVTVSQILQAIPHPPTELLKAVQSLKRRCLLKDAPNWVGASNVENYCSALLKINPIFKNYLSSLPLLPT
jgi:hypothetical protein